MARIHSLRLALVVYIVLPLLLVMAGTGYISLRSLEASIEERLRSDMELVARAIQLPLSRALERNERRGLAQALESAFTIDQVYGAYVYDGEGHQIASLGMREMFPAREQVGEIAAEGYETGRFEEVAGQEVFSYFIALTDSGGRINGLLQLTRRATDFQNYIHNLRMGALALLLGSAVIMTALVLFGHQQALGRHVAALTRSMTRVGQGDYRHRAQPSGPKEIVELGHAFNRMLDDIERAEQEIETRRETQQDLEDRLRHAEKLAAIGQLAAGVAHELGTPLSVVEGKAQRALRNRDLPEPVNRDLQSVRDAVRRMERIVRQLLDFGRRQKPQPRTVQTARLLGAAAETVATEARESGTTVKVETAPDLTFHADPVQLDQVLVNLLRNAIHAAAGGTVSASAWREGEHVHIAVDDDGPGIPEADRSRIFDPFYTTKRVGEGTGLGLAVVHGIVEAHAGRVEIGRSPRGGARFEIVLPLKGPYPKGQADG